MRVFRGVDLPDGMEQGLFSVEIEIFAHFPQKISLKFGYKDEWKILPILVECVIFSHDISEPE